MKNKKVLVTGANGAVASDLVPALLSKGYDVLATDIDCPSDNPFKLHFMDIRNLSGVLKVFRKYKPHIVIHLAAEVDVEYCELNPRHAKETNALGTENIAKASKEIGATLVYMSSIGVFDGKKKGSYNELDKPNPINIYGKSKYQGELYVEKYVKKHFIMRAGWMIGGYEKDKKFVVKLIKLIKKGVKILEVVNDKSGTPTYTPDLAELICGAIKTKEYGIYHVVSRGNPTRYDVAKKILTVINRKDIVLKKIHTKDISKVYFANRPANETADSSKINKLVPKVIRPWQECLEDYLSHSFGFDTVGSEPLVSIVICLYLPTDRFFKDLLRFKKLKYKNIELIVVSDKEVQLPQLNFPTKLVLTGKDRTGVGEKRDYALMASKGDYIAYIDDDAYPDPQWISNALLDFLHPNVGAVGGPNVTPKEDSYWAKVGGYIYESYLASGGAQHRFLPKEKRTVDELQGVNLIIRKNVLKKIGGFSTKLFSGDDTKVCYSIKLLGYEILYDPKVVVNHHRREFPNKHLRQIKTMGTHRGYFARKYPLTSMNPIYFAPTAFFLLCIFLIIAALYSQLFLLFALSFVGGVYLLAYMSTLKRSGYVTSFVVAAGILLTHLVYGANFLKGFLLIQNLEHK